MTDIEGIRTLLLAAGGADYCDRCLAERLGVPLEAATEAAAAVGREPLFLRDVWACAGCGEWTKVTRALGRARPAPPEPAEAPPNVERHDPAANPDEHWDEVRERVAPHAPDRRAAPGREKRP